MSEFKIDIAEEFEHLARAPIIEAVIDIRANATGGWEMPSLAATLEARLPDYPNVIEQKKVLASFKVSPGTLTQAEQHELSKGLQFKSADGLRVAAFHRDGFTFSHLSPYSDWQHLKDEALRLWGIHATISNPVEILRAGLRFINRIELPPPPEPIQLSDYIVHSPSTPIGLDLPLTGFLHVDTLTTEPYPYTVNVVRTIQPAEPPRFIGAIILDIDVFVAQNVPYPDDGWIEKRLAEMRWLKNKVFFGSITAKAKERFK
jgi:uncharacterized protein (TIGR04255 family)